jgi:RNA polymerase sigma-70 factor (ECF subfamily)
LNFSAARRNLSSVDVSLGLGGHRMSDPADRIYERLLVLRCQAGDGAAFGELVERYGPRLRYFLRKMLRESGAAEDALQEVWLDVYRGMPRLADPGALAAWLYRVARCRAYRALRRRRRPHVPLEEAQEAEAPAEEDFSAEDAARIHAALEWLAPEHREVLVLRFLEDMSYDDVARVTGCALGTVKSRLYHAKRALRRALGEGKQA